MAELPHYPGTPRWAKLFGLIFGVVVLLFFALMFIRGPHHGSGHHRPSAVMEDGAQQP